MKLASLFCLTVGLALGADKPFPVQGTFGTYAGSSATCTFMAPVTNGNLVVMNVSYEAGTPGAISDTVGTTFTQIGTITGQSVINTIWAGLAPTTAPDTITFTLTSGSSVRPRCGEIAGVGTTVDVTASGTWTGGPGTVTVPVTTTVNGTGLLIAFVSNSTLGPFLNVSYPTMALAANANGLRAGMLAFQTTGTRGSNSVVLDTNIAPTGNYLILGMRPSTFSVTTSALPSAVVNVPYSFQMEAAGGAGVYTWSIIAGTLPTGLTMSSSGLISGTPTLGLATQSITFQVTDGTLTTSKAISMAMGAIEATMSVAQTNAAAGTGVPFALASSVTEGSALLYVTTYSNINAGLDLFPAPTDTLGTVYKLVATWGYYSTGGSRDQASLYIGTAPTGGMLTLTPRQGAVGATCFLAELAGTQGIADVVSFSSGTAGTGGSTFTASGVTTLTPHSMVYTNAGAFDLAARLTLQAPFTITARVGNLVDNNSLGYRLVSSVGTYAPSWAITGSYSDGRWYSLTIPLRSGLSGTPPSVSSYLGQPTQAVNTYW